MNRRFLSLLVLSAVVFPTASCNRLPGGVRLLGSCLDAIGNICTEIRIDLELSAPDKADLHREEDTACTVAGGVYSPGENCADAASAQRSCTLTEDMFQFDLDLTITRVILYLEDYESEDNFQTEEDDCESQGGEFRDSDFVFP